MYRRRIALRMPMNEPVSLSEQHGVELFPVAPFHFDATYMWEDLFWKRKNQDVEWLEKLIRL